MPRAPRNRYREGAITWTAYAAITVDARSSSANNVTVTIPKDLDAFWLAVTAESEIRILAADGVTKATYEIDNGSGSTFDGTAITNRTGRIKIGSYTRASAAMCRMVLAWAPQGGTPSTGGTSVSLSTPVTGYLAQEQPRNVIRARPEPVGALVPSPRVQKGSGETLLLAVDVTALLPTRDAGSYGGGDGIGGLSYASYAAVDSNSSPYSSMVDAASLRFLGDWGVSFTVTAGVSGTVYTVIPTLITTTSPAETYTPKVQVSVRDVVGS